MARKEAKAEDEGKKPVATKCMLVLVGWRMSKRNNKTPAL